MGLAVEGKQNKFEKDMGVKIKFDILAGYGSKRAQEETEAFMETLSTKLYTKAVELSTKTRHKVK